MCEIRFKLGQKFKESFLHLTVIGGVNYTGVHILAIFRFSFCRLSFKENIPP